MKFCLEVENRGVMIKEERFRVLCQHEGFWVEGDLFSGGTKVSGVARRHKAGDEEEGEDGFQGMTEVLWNAL